MSIRSVPPATQSEIDDYFQQNLNVPAPTIDIPSLVRPTVGTQFKPDPTFADWMSIVQGLSLIHI